jgi:hypothetical protein
MIYSRTKLASLLLFFVTFYGAYSYNIQFYITQANDFSHLNMSHHLFISSQKLLLNMTIFTSFLLIGFGHKYHYVFLLIRRNKSGESLYLPILLKSALISAFIAFQSITVQITVFAFNGLRINLEVLSATFLIVFIYTFSVCSLYTVFYIFTLRHVQSLSAAVLLRLLLLILLMSYAYSGQDFHLDRFLYIYITVEFFIVNIVVYYLLKNKERFAI